MRLARLATLVFCGILVPRLFAFREPDLKQLPDFDRREKGKTELSTEKQHGAAELKKAVPAATIDFDPVTGSPRFITAHDGFLTGRAGYGRGIQAKTFVGIPAADPNRVTKAFLKEHKELFGYGPEVLNDAIVKREFTTAHNGLRTVIWQQQLDGIPVFEALLISHTSKEDELVNISSRFVPAIAVAKVGANNRAALAANPPLPVQKAIAIAAKSVGDDADPAKVVEIGFKDTADNVQKHRRFADGGLRGETDTRLVWLPLDDKTLRLAWDITLSSKARNEMFHVLVDAQTGEVLVRRNLTRYISDATYNIFSSDSPSPLSPGHSTPTNTQPPLVSRVLVTTNAANTTASPNGWIDDNMNWTAGNNVDAHLDRDALDGTSGRVAGSPNRVFDFPLDLTNGPAAYSDASVVNMFYWCNWMHDRLYELGFTEAAGNYQVTNFNRGGWEDDAIQADAQDGANLNTLLYRNNANFSTPAYDGVAPRMQMYVFDGPNPDRDGALDTETVLHEITHGLTDRVVGGGLMTQTQSRGMGEGWSDFFALTLLANASDDTNGVYPFSAYVSYELSPGLDENYYYGIRRYPYSIDMSKNPLTFKDIDTMQADVHAGVPRSPYPYFGAADELHNVGEVWCSALWEARALLIGKYGFTNGTDRILHLVTDGMFLCPPNPNFLQARDAIIQAARLQPYNGADVPELWSAFAKRGMGFFASSPSSSTTRGVSESFALPDDLYISPSAGLTASGNIGGPFLPNTQIYGLTNIGTNTLTWQLTKSAPWLSASATNGTLSASAGTNIVISINFGVANTLPAGIYTDRLYFTNQTSGIGQSRAIILRVGQPDYLTELFSANDLDVAYQTFTFTPDGTSSGYAVCRTVATNFPTDPSGGTVATFTTSGSYAATDDGWATVTLSTNVSLFGRSTNKFHIGSNGYITLQSGDYTPDESLPGHMDQLRVSALFHDLDVTFAGTISWKQLSNRVAVTYYHVPPYGTTNKTNDFQIELFYDGVIRVTYLQVDLLNALVGLSAGQGVPGSFVESDLSGFSECAPHVTVTLPANASEGDGTLTNAGTVSIPLPLATNLTVTFYSTDPTEVTASSTTIIAGQTNAAFDINVVDDADVDGTRMATITAVAPPMLNGQSTIAIFDNEPVTLSVNLADTAEGEGSIQGSVTINAPSANDVIITFASSDTTELLVPSTITIPAGQNSIVFTASVIDDGEIDGSQEVTLTAHMQNWTDGTANVVVGDNESTNLTVLLPSSVREGNGTLPSAGVVKISGSVPTNVVVSLASDDATAATVPSSVTILAGRTSVAFSITVVDDASVDGNQTANISAAASSFGTGSSPLVVTDDEIPLAPASPFPPHLSANNSITVNLSWEPGFGEGVELLTNGVFETGDASGWSNTTNVYSRLVVHDGSFVPAGGDSATAPASGNYSALLEQLGVGTLVMFQDVTLPSASLVTLSWSDCIRNLGSAFSTTQQYRVELRDTNNTTLSVVYSTSSTNELLNSWVTRNANISAYRGQRVRLAFVLQSNSSLDVHLDDVSVRATEPALTTYSVYFSTNSVLTPTDLLGTTTNTTWDVPVLNPFVTYYWMVVATRGGETNASSWQFTTVPDVSIADTTVSEGNAGTTNATFVLTLATPSDQTVTMQAFTVSDTADASDFVSTTGTVTFNPGETNATFVVPILGDTTYEYNETFFVRLTNGVNCALGDSVAIGTIVNDEPFLFPIADKTVNEGSTLTFTPQTGFLGTPEVKTITDFESYTNVANGAVMFREPRNNSLTSALLSGSPNISVVTNVFPSGHSGARVLRTSWSFTSNSVAWLKLVTKGATDLPNPTIDFNQVLQFDIYTDRPLRLGFGIRETSTTNDIGADGGANGNVEYVGVTNGSAPSATSPAQPVRTLLTNVWQTVSFFLPYEPVAGSGTLDSATGKGVLDSLLFTPVSSTNVIGTNNVYLDNFSVIYSNVLTFSLSNAPSGATINPNTGIFSWTPTEAQGPGVYSVTINVTQNSSTPVTHSQTFNITVNEVNIRPTLSFIGNKTVNEQATLTFTAIANDTDIPTNTLTFSLDPDAPEGASIDPNTGVFTWTPDENQGGAIYPITVRVTDDATSPLSSTNRLYVTVNEVNSAPVLSSISDRTVHAGMLVSFVAEATDPDVPFNSLSFDLLGIPPSGASIDSNSGAFTWQTEATEAAGTNTISVRVTDNGSPTASDTKTFSVIVETAPHIENISLSSDTVTISWTAIAGVTYRLQYKDAVDDSWNDLTPDVTATGSIASSTDPISATTRFYRVIVP